MNPELIEKIESYLEGKVNRSELAIYAFDLRASELQENIEWVKNSQLAIEAAGLNDQLNTLFKEAKKDRAKIINFNSTKFKWLVAASLAILVSGFWFFTNSSKDNIYSQFEYFDPGLPVVMGESSRYEFDDAMTYFKEQNFIESSIRFANLNLVQTNDTLIYYLGASQFYSNDLSSARQHLITVSKNSNSIYQEKAEWLLILLSVREDNLLVAREKLKPITLNRDHIFHSQAIELLTKLP